MDFQKVRDHISYSSVNKYLGCPKRWHYDYVIAPEKPKKSLALELGTRYHNAVEKLYTTGEYEEGLKILKEFASESGRFAQKDIKAVTECFKNYYLSVYPLYQSRVQSVELTGKVDVSGIKVPLEYRMDLVTTDGTIIDHKTVGRMHPRIDYSLQFDLYSYAYYKNYGVLPRTVEYHNAYKTTGGVEVVGKMPCISDMLKAIACVVGMVKSVEADIFMPKYSKACNYCPHREMCNREFGSI